MDVLKILVPTDGSAFARRGLAKAIEFAEKFTAEITLLNVQLELSDGGGAGPWGVIQFPDRDKALKNAENILAQEVAFAAEKGARVNTEVSFGNPADQIVGFADSNKFDFIVIGSEGLSGIKRFLLGSVASRVVAHAHCTIVVVKIPD